MRTLNAHTPKLHLTGALLCALGATVACGPQVVRGADTPGLDQEALSTGLDRRDLEKMLRENLDSLKQSAVVRRWEGENRPAVAILPIRNETSEHIDSALSAMLSDIETTLINAGHVRVISRERQDQLISEIRKQKNNDAFNPSQIAMWGQQVGARYFVTGKVYTTDERFDGQRRVQYYMFMQVIDAQTGDILWQNKAAVTKAMFS